ncbi:tyrosinase-like [Acipenser ruthenus]|uniref:tyrosinase-like n=1 Tax=Acipenser ruthenus TaxID=7906 RepID=UPI0027410B7C|nr:tyrosinase-like [Acipenser ruthenus]
MLQFVMLLLLLPNSLDAHFPKPCTTDEALNTKTCCPEWEGSPCGVRAGRGECDSYRTIQTTDYIDYREQWPFHFYHSLCRCHGNFDGFDCGLCKHGFKGHHCNITHTTERKEIHSLTEEEKTKFFKYLEYSKTNISSKYSILTSNDTSINSTLKFINASLYDVYIWMHYYAAKPLKGTGRNVAHEGPAFPFWHRMFLLFFEREVREMTSDDSFFIPYWNWTKTDHCDICNNDYFGESNATGLISPQSQFSKWKPICDKDNNSLGIICIQDLKESSILRNPGGDPTSNTLPTSSDVQKTIEVSEYDVREYNRSVKHSFRNTLEGYDVPQDFRQLNSAMHNLVHNYLNGTMCDVPTAVNDPIFMVHHSFVDKILEEWMDAHPDATYPENSDTIPEGQKANDFMVPFFPLVQNKYFMNHSIAFGYRYADDY